MHGFIACHFSYLYTAYSFGCKSYEDYLMPNCYDIMLKDITEVAVQLHECTFSFGTMFLTIMVETHKFCGNQNTMMATTK